MPTTHLGIAMPGAEREPVCSCHCHESVFCPECNRPTGPLDDDTDARVQAVKSRIWARLLTRHPEWTDE